MLFSLIEKLLYFELLIVIEDNSNIDKKLMIQKIVELIVVLNQFLSLIYPHLMLNFNPSILVKGIKLFLHAWYSSSNVLLFTIGIPMFSNSKYFTPDFFKIYTNINIFFGVIELSPIFNENFVGLARYTNSFIPSQVSINTYFDCSSSSSEHKRQKTKKQGKNMTNMQH